MAIEQINAMSLEDFVENPLKIFVYKLNNIGNAITFIQEGAHSIVSIESYTKGNVEKDKDGNGYIKAIPQMNQNSEFQHQNTESFGNVLENSLTAEIWCADLPSAPEAQLLQLGSYDITPFFFTIGSPFDIEKYESKENPQQIFITSPVININETELDEDLLINEGYQEATLINLKEITKDMENSVVIPYLDIQNLENPTILKNKLEVPGFSLIQKNNMFLSLSKGITVKVQTEESDLTDINIKTVKPLLPFKVSPINAKSNQIELLFDWFDYDIATPLEIVKFFNKPNIVNSVLSEEQDRKAFLDMIAIAYAFISEFDGFPRYTSGPDTGKLIPGNYIGWVKYDVTALIRKTPTIVLGNVYQKWKRDTRLSDDDKRTRNFKNMMAMCSQIIGGKYSIGGTDDNGIAGSNSFNQIYLPWYLELASSIVIEDIGTNQKGLKDYKNNTDKNSLLFVSQSKYFDKDKTTKEFKLKPEFVLSDTKLVQTDRKLTLPTIPNEIEIIDKLQLPGDIDTKSNKDLKYFVLLPIEDQGSFEKIFSSDSDAKPKTEATFDTNWTTWGKSLSTGSKLNNFIIKEASKLYNIPQAEIQVINSGTESSKTGNILSYNYSNFLKGRIYGETTCNKLGWSPFADKFDSDAIIKISNNSKSCTAQAVYFNTWDSWQEYDYKYKLKSFRRNNVTVKFGKSHVYVPDRKSIYNLNQYQKFISDLRLFKNLEYEHLIQTERNIKIKRIKEIEIGTIWGEYIKIVINGNEFKINLFQKEEETIGRQKIIFT